MQLDTSAPDRCVFQALADVKRLKSDLLLLEDEIRVLKSQRRRGENEDTSGLVGEGLKIFCFSIIPKRLNLISK